MPLLSAGIDYNVENGLDHILRVSWTTGSPGTFTASLKNLAATVTYATISYSFNPMTLFGTNSPYFGFTGSTGGLSNQQSFCNPPVLLPVELVRFDITCDDHKATLTWITESEKKNADFAVERTGDGISYETIAVVKSNGNSTRSQLYQW